MEQVVDRRKISYQEWLNYRRSGIGGSDAGAIAGLNPYKSSISVYLDKTGQIEPVEQTDAMYWGTVLEKVVADEFTTRTNLKVRKNNTILRSEEYPFMIANIDRVVAGVQEGLECKTTNVFNKDLWKNGSIPDVYMAQVQHYMAVTGFQAWWIAVLIGGNDFRYKRVERDDEFINLLIQLEQNFWLNHVEPQVMPEVDGSTASNEIINKMFPETTKNSIVKLPDDAKTLIESFLENSALEEKYSNLKDECGNKIKLLMEQNEQGIIGNYVVNWKQVKSKKFDTKSFEKENPELHHKYCKESSYRRFTVKSI